MYNHYTPQSDGSYRRSTVPENNRRPQQRPQPPKQEPAVKPAPPPPPVHCPEPERSVPPPPPRKDGNILSFLRELLPREIDSVDLIVILLLILMNRDEDADGLSPILTLALYFLL